MTTMDVKAISWVGDIYQKFEAMCVEVEETMYQDSVDYVENQVKTVGACVKRFYSDVMQDLLPLSPDDSVKLENTGLNLVHYADDGVYKKSNLVVKREQVKSESEYLCGDSYLACQLDQIGDNRLSSGSYQSSGLYELPAEESSAVPGLHLNQRGTEDVCSCNIDKSENVDSQLALLSKDGKSTSVQGKMFNETDECVASTSITSSPSNPDVCDEYLNDEAVLKMSDGSDEPVRDKFESDDIDKEAFQVSEQLGKLKLDESCVLVDKYEQFSVPHLEGKQKSYKKKIRDVLYIRRWSRSKNPNRLILRQESVDSDDNLSRENMLSASQSESSKTNLESSSLESGWEIL